MKQLKTITEKEILEAAYSVYLERWAKESDAADACGWNNGLLNERAKIAWEKAQEIRIAILEIEEEDEEEDVDSLDENSSMYVGYFS